MENSYKYAFYTNILKTEWRWSDIEMVYVVYVGISKHGGSELNFQLSINNRNGQYVLSSFRLLKNVW